MKFEIFNGQTNDVTYLKLFKDSDGDISLVAVNSEGDKVLCGNILYITTKGYLHRNTSVNTSLGLKLDECGRISLR